MKQNICTLRSALTCAFFVTLLSGCATALNKPTGPAFSPQTVSRPDKALIFFYRPTGESFGYGRVYSLEVNGKIITDLPYGGYYPYETEPGKLLIAADLNKGEKHRIGVGLVDYYLRPDAAKVDIVAEAGHIYYVKFHPETHPMGFVPRLYLVTNDLGEHEIKDCKLIQASVFQN